MDPVVAGDCNPDVLVGAMAAGQAGRTTVTTLPKMTALPGCGWMRGLARKEPECDTLKL